MSGGDAVGPAVAMLGPPRRAVPERELDGAGQRQVLEIATRRAARDAGRLGELHRREVALAPLQGLDDGLERRRGDALRQAVPPVRAQQREDVVDVVLVGLPQPLEAAVQRRVALEPLAQRVEEERLHEIVDDTAVDRRTQRCNVLRCGPRDHVDVRLPGFAQRAQHLEPTQVGQVDVEEKQIGAKPARELERTATAVRFADDLIARHPLDVRPVDGRGHRIVVDDERADHDATATREYGRNTVKIAPPSDATSTQPPRLRAVCETSASPRPRRPAPVATFVVKPSRKISSTIAASTPGPESCTRTSVPSSSARIVTSIQPPPALATESSALSMRFAATVTMSRAFVASSSR